MRKLRYAIFLCALPALRASAPLVCPAGAPLGSFRMSVTRGEKPALKLSIVNQLLEGDRISYTPGTVNSPDKKKARVALVLVPSDHGKILVLDARPALEAAEWTVPVRTQIVTVVYGPQGLDKGKVADLVKKNEDVIGQLADYAAKTEETQAILQALAQQQQTLASGQDVNAAVVSFANQFPGAPAVDRTQPLNVQALTVLRGVNPALGAYDPLAPNPSQRAAQSAGIAAAVAGLFFGTNVGLAATGGALLINMHSLIFPGTEFRSAFAQPVADHKDQTALCGNKTPSAARTELAFLWATRVPDAPAPEISIPKQEHLAIGVKSSVPIAVKARDESLAARVQNWKLEAMPDSKPAVAVTAKVNTQTKKLELDTNDPQLKPGLWKLTGSWDWTEITAGEVDLRAFSTFGKAHLAPESHDRLVQGSGKVNLTLEGDDFEFVDKLAYKATGDPFAQPSTLPFHLPKGPGAGPQETLETQMDASSLTAGEYRFLIAQGDEKVHETPFEVLPATPHISNLPLMVHTLAESERVVLKGTGLDRIEELSSPEARIRLEAGDKADERVARITLKDGIVKGTSLAVRMTVKDFEQPIEVSDALLVAGPRPAITEVHASLPSDLGVALRAGEIPAHSFVSFSLDLANVDAASVNAVDLSCGDAPPVPLKVRPEAHAPLFLSFDPSTVGTAGCEVSATLETTDAGTSLPAKLGVVVRLPKIESFQLTGEKADGNAFYGELKGQGLESIEKVGWDAVTGTPVRGIPAPVAGGGSQQVLKVAVPWPAPAPHAQLYIWLRGESSGRATTARW